jgi:hypothetical protein
MRSVLNSISSAKSIAYTWTTSGAARCGGPVGRTQAVETARSWKRGWRRVRTFDGHVSTYPCCDRVGHFVGGGGTVAGGGGDAAG